MSIRTKTKKYGHRSLGKEQFTFLPYTDHMCTPLYSFLKLSKTVPIVFITKLQLETQQVHTLLVQLPEEGRLQSMSIVKMTSINFLMEFFDFFYFFFNGNSELKPNGTSLLILFQLEPSPSSH